MRDVTYQFQIVKRHYGNIIWEEVILENIEEFRDVKEIFCDILRELFHPVGGFSLDYYHTDGSVDVITQTESCVNVHIIRSGKVFILNDKLNFAGKYLEFRAWGGSESDFVKIGQMREYYIKEHIPLSMQRHFLR